MYRPDGLENYGIELELELNLNNIERIERNRN